MILGKLVVWKKTKASTVGYKLVLIVVLETVGKLLGPGPMATHAPTSICPKALKALKIPEGPKGPSDPEGPQRP